MIIVGTATKQIYSGKISSACTNCQEPDSINTFVVHRYAHVYYIPFVPSAKRTIAQCSKCSYVLEQHYFPESYNSEYKSLNLTTKTPIWMYSGLGILAVIIIAVFVSVKLDNKENAELVLSPQKGDIYEIMLSNKEYTLYKVDKVEGNAVYMFENEFATDQASGTSDLLEKPFYKESVPIMKSDLKMMLEKGQIMDIER